MHSLTNLSIHLHTRLKTDYYTQTTTYSRQSEQSCPFPVSAEYVDESFPSRGEKCQGWYTTLATGFQHLILHHHGCLHGLWVHFPTISSQSTER